MNISKKLSLSLLGLLSTGWLVPGGIVACAQEAATRPVAEKNLWMVYQPYAGNPLRDAITAGSLTFGTETRAAELEIECRAPQLARMNLRFPAENLKFNLDPFEGPPGIGQKRKLLSIKLAGYTAVAHTFNGFYVESNVFVLAVAPSRSEMRRIASTNAAKTLLRVQVSAADDKGEPLIFHFTLPADNALAREVIRPCNASPAKDREPDPR